MGLDDLSGDLPDDSDFAPWYLVDQGLEIILIEVIFDCVREEVVGQVGSGGVGAVGEGKADPSLSIFGL